MLRLNISFHALHFHPAFHAASPITDLNKKSREHIQARGNIELSEWKEDSAVHGITVFILLSVVQALNLPIGTTKKAAGASPVTLSEGIVTTHHDWISLSNYSKNDHPWSVPETLFLFKSTYTAVRFVINIASLVEYAIMLHSLPHSCQAIFLIYCCHSLYFTWSHLVHISRGFNSYSPSSRYMNWCIINSLRRVAKSSW